jgi:hypothetical protein
MLLTTLAHTAYQTHFQIWNCLKSGCEIVLYFALAPIFLFLCFYEKETSNTHYHDILLNPMLAAQRLQ